MAEPIMCTCGAVLVEEVTAAGVRPVGSDEVIPFRRTTDYVICATCFESYDVRSLIEQTESKEIISHLELMAEEATDEPV
jgi:hypothetical protein